VEIDSVAQSAAFVPLGTQRGRIRVTGYLFLPLRRLFLHLEAPGGAISSRNAIAAHDGTGMARARWRWTPLRLRPHSVMVNSR